MITMMYIPPCNETLSPTGKKVAIENHSLSPSPNLHEKLFFVSSIGISKVQHLDPGAHTTSPTTQPESSPVAERRAPSSLAFSHQ